MRKLLTIILTVMILYNAILPTHFYKIKANSDPLYQEVPLDVNSLLGGNTTDEPHTEVNGDDREVSQGSSIGGAMVTILFDVINVIPMVGSVLMSVAVHPEENIESTNSARRSRC